VLRAIVTAGTRAPSGDNCQPWRFRWDGDCLRIAFVASRAASLYDVADRASFVSLGAVGFNMAITARSLGYEMAAEYFPPGESGDVVARIRFEAVPVRRDPLLDSIERRCVNRRPYRREDLFSVVRDDLLAAGSTPGVHVSWIDDEATKNRVARIAAENDRVVFENRALHDGLYRWLRWSRHDPRWARDGMPADTLELTAMERPGIRLLGSWPVSAAFSALGLTRTLPVRAARLYRRSAAIGLVTVPGGSREDFVRGGEAVQRLWLTATARRVAFQPITGITCLMLRLRLANGDGLHPRHRALIADLAEQLAAAFPRLEQEVPVMLFRVGLAAPPSGRAPRLPVGEVFEIGDGGSV